MADWNLENAAHLLRRAAFGGTRQEIQAFYDRHASVAEAVEELINFPVSKKKPPKGGKDFYKAMRKQKQWWLKTMLTAKSPRDAMREKMVLYWHNHLCSGYSKQYYASYMAIQNGLLRRYASGNFRDLIRDFNRDPANLYYLDGIVNYASDYAEPIGNVSVNENFAREVLELFTTGISQLAADGTNDPAKPCYSESDVHQLARAVSGWVEIEKDVGIWQDWAWDGGTLDDNADGMPDDVSIFGVTNNGFKIGWDVANTPNDVLALILAQEDDDGNNQTAMFVCRKLWTWFVYPAPAPGLKALLEPIAATFVAGNWQLVPVLRAILNHDEFYSDAAKSRTVMNPVDYVVGTFRSLGVKSKGRTINDSPELIDMLEDMGMELGEPPNVAGWPGGLRWITTGTLVGRLDFARRVAEADYGQSMLKLETVLTPATLGNAAADPGTVADEIIHRLGLNDAGGGMSDIGRVAFTAAQRAALVNFLTDDGSQATLDLTDAWTDDARIFVRGAIALALQSGEAQIF